MISGDGVGANPKKLQAIQDWPTPKNVKQLRGFLGLVVYYRKFNKAYGKLAKLLTELLKKNNFHWDESTSTAFQQFKTAIMAPPVLALPDISLPFIVEIDASATGIREVLLQNGIPLSFLSKALFPKQKGYQCMKKRCLQ
ncbi:hypothetical protein ACH5RR_036956 [Cinchona calisaya]|uniref:Reverse transcriptase/retrotransposon-derived protein RNase H-like domain-containing protein n=1 Tax=Cinchona calisaya TaxID=153742 RepID=A0ABD2Y7U6_9GENT